MHASEDLKEAERLMTICNACRYCEGLCAVFPAMETRRIFADGDLNYLANLCHNCGACYTDCQYSPPHEFDINVPRVLARVRAGSWRTYAWPRRLQPLFDRNGLALSIITAFSVAAFILGFVLWHDHKVLFTDRGNFYRLLPHELMAGLFLAATAFTLMALAIGARNFWRDINAGQSIGLNPTLLWDALRNAGSLRYLDGGGEGCFNEDDQPTDRRRVFHHLTFYGFMLCFAATLSGSFFHYILDMPAPYQWYEIPKILGSVGGLAMVIGASGLLCAKLRRDPAMLDTARLGMDTGFILMILMTGLTGMLLMLLRNTPAMGVMLALHLGVVFALYLTMPYSKFVHGLYRFAALVRYAMETKSNRRNDM